MNINLLISILKQAVQELMFLLAFELGKIISNVEIKNKMIKDILTHFIQGATKHVRNYIPTRMYRV